MPRSKSKAARSPKSTTTPQSSDALASALAFYADPASWVTGGDAFAPTPAPVAADRGTLARNALAREPSTVQVVWSGTADTVPTVVEQAKPDTERFSQFQMEPKAGDGRRMARVEPFKPGLKNQFKDDGKLEARASLVKTRDGRTVDFDKVVIASRTPTERNREPVRSRKTTVTCWKCNRPFEVDAFDARPALASDDSDQMRNVCQDCMRSAIRR